MAQKKGKTAQNGGSIRQRSDGRWEARVTVGTNPGTGKPIRRSIYGDTQAEVRKQMTAILREIDRGTYQTPDKTTVSEWMKTWMETYCEGKVKPLTFQTYQGVIKNHINPHVGALQVQKVKGLDIQKLYNSMTKAGLSGKTVKNVSAILHKAFSVAMKQGIIAANPVDGAELPRVERHEITPLRDEEIPLFLSAIDASPFRNAYALCLFAGLREGECLGLSWSQVDSEKGKITVSQQLQQSKETGECYIAPFTKNSKPRTIEPPPIAFQYIRAERARQSENRLKAGAAWSNPDNLVFTNEQGGHYVINTFYKRFKRIAASIGRPDARPHDLRHTAATVALAAGSDVKSVQGMMGHATAAFTLDRYGHVIERMMKDTANRMQNYYDGLSKMG